MKIQKIINQNRRDFTAIYECEHCGHTEQGSGYDDTYFHQEVIPAMACKNCHETAGENFRALAPKYSDSQTV